ncbi:hypothetical protein ACFWP0_09260 [Achromobacter sp. NPDC058515]|uniref:hypothetical protein n=1 Tax=Achromobacter sp. NPDC058515 TaxID=3346533 RepID=UPI003655D996
MTTTHTPGPWEIDGEYVQQADQTGVAVCDVMNMDVGGATGWYSGPVTQANKHLIAAAPELLEALEEAVDLAWIEDSHQVQFDPTVIFSEFYDFSGVDGTSRIEFHGQHECIVWPGTKWSAYCTYDGSLWFEKFDTAEEAKEACMRLLDRVLPDHPAMRARAVIRKARGAQ